MFVMVTRPEPAGKELCDYIESHGIQTVYFPTIIFAPPLDECQFHQSIQNLSEQDWLIFVSPQSVYASVNAMQKTWPILPAGIKVAAIGEGTAKALKAAGLNALYPSQWNSEGLLALPEFCNIKNSKIAIIKGEGGRAILETTLKHRGANVSTMIAYRRVMPNLDMDSYIQLLQSKKISIIVCTSFESIQNLKKLLCTEWSFLKEIPLIVVSERIKKLAHNLGFQTIWVASNASHEAIFARIGKAYARNQ